VDSIVICNNDDNELAWIYVAHDDNITSRQLFVFLKAPLSPNLPIICILLVKISRIIAPVILIRPNSSA